GPRKVCGGFAGADCAATAIAAVATAIGSIILFALDRGMTGISAARMTTPYPFDSISCLRARAETALRAHLPLSGRASLERNFCQDFVSARPERRSRGRAACPRESAPGRNGGARMRVQAARSAGKKAGSLR